MECRACSKCDSSAERRCVTCESNYCHSCFNSHHIGGRSSHISADIKTGAYFNVRDMESMKLLNVDDLFPDSDSSLGLVKVNDGFSSLYTSLSVERPPLFETNVINEYGSLSNIQKVLEVEDDVKLNVVTFIGKPNSSKKVLANELLMKEGPYKFPSCNENSLLCRVACDDSGSLLVLQTENMYKGIDGKVTDQTNLLRLLITLSDVIIFTQTTPDRPEDQKRSIIRDYLRIHDIMSLCKNEFNPYYQQINKKEPQKLAPGFIYLVESEFNFNESLSQSIADCTGKSCLFESFSKVLRYDGNDDDMFQYGLRQMLQDLAGFRSSHSLEEIVTCIRDCKQSIVLGVTEPPFRPTIPSKWYLCRQMCLICHGICTKPFGHSESHENETPCIETEENKVYFCKRCIKEDSPSKSLPLVFKAKGKEENFFTSAVWYTFRGRVIECERHGIILDNNWLYNYYEDMVVCHCIHKWPGCSLISQNVYPMGQMVIDKLTEVSKPIHKVLSDSANTITDKFIIPETWDRTSSAIECHCCKHAFTSAMSKHHCRNCGVVVCTACFVNKQSQSLCTSCVDRKPQQYPNEDPAGLKIVNFVKSPISAVSNFVRKTVTSINRPDYWEDDDVVIRCFICNNEFHSEMRPIHHCRACGKCVCDECSPQSRPVEWRYLHEPSRVCDLCIKTDVWRQAP